MAIMNKWITRFLEMAKLISTWSKDPSTKIGIIVANDSNHILGTGYNGFPSNIDDAPERYANREVKYDFVIHAEMNLIYNATYSGVSLKGGILYCYGLPICKECAKGVIQVGIKRVYMLLENDFSDKWKESWQKTRELFDEAGVEWYFVRNNKILEKGKEFKVKKKTIKKGKRVFLVG